MKLDARRVNDLMEFSLWRHLGNFGIFAFGLFHVRAYLNNS